MINLKSIPTNKLVEELVRREDVVSKHYVEPYQEYSIEVDEKNVSSYYSDGPVVILEIVD